jgi:DNA-binding transcriptional MocR family regulator
MVSRLLDGWAAVTDDALYLRLALAMTDLIQSNTLPDGTVLPSQRSLAEALGIARGTVTRVYEKLAAEELIEARQGAGSRIRRRVAIGSPAGDGRLVSYNGHRGTEIDLTSGALPGLPVVATAFGGGHLFCRPRPRRGPAAAAAARIVGSASKLF